MIFSKQSGKETERRPGVIDLDQCNYLKCRLWTSGMTQRQYMEEQSCFKIVLSTHDLYYSNQMQDIEADWTQ